MSHIFWRTYLNVLHRLFSSLMNNQEHRLIILPAGSYDTTDGMYSLYKLQRYYDFQRFVDYWELGVETNEHMLCMKSLHDARPKS